MEIMVWMILLCAITYFMNDMRILIINRKKIKLIKRYNSIIEVLKETEILKNKIIKIEGNIEGIKYKKKFLKWNDVSLCMMRKYIKLKSYKIGE